MSEWLRAWTASVWITGVILGLWRWPWVVLLLLAVGSGVLLRVWSTPADRAIFVFAALVGVAGELLCTMPGVDFWIYTPRACPFGWEVPLWLPLVWGYLMVLFRRVALAVIDELPSWKAGRWVLLGGFFGLLASLPVLVSPGYVEPVVLWGYWIFAALMLWRWRTSGDVATLYVGGILGTLGEYLCIHEGIWRYRVNLWSLPWPLWDVGGVERVPMPVSIPLAWGLSAVIVKHVGEWWEARGLPRAPSGE